MILPAPDEAIWIGVARVALRVPGAHSLKEKRKSVARVRDRLRNRAHFSVAEVGHLDDRSRAVLAIAMVSNAPRTVRSAFDGLLPEIAGWSEALIESFDVSLEPAFGPEVY